MPKIEGVLLRRSSKKDSRITNKCRVRPNFPLTTISTTLGFCWKISANSYITFLIGSEKNELHDGQFWGPKIFSIFFPPFPSKIPRRVAQKSHILTNFFFPQGHFFDLWKKFFLKSGFLFKPKKKSIGDPGKMAFFHYLSVKKNPPPDPENATS